MTMGTKANAMRGPWEQVTYSGDTRQVAYFDSTGERANICDYWDEDFGALLEKAWAVPQLMDLLQRMINLEEKLNDKTVGVEQIADICDAIEAAHIEARALLEKLS